MPLNHRDTEYFCALAFLWPFNFGIKKILPLFQFFYMALKKNHPRSY